jgi:anti-anti-sigma regulatory factor
MEFLMTSTSNTLEVVLPADCAGSFSVLEFTDSMRRRLDDQPKQVVLDGSQIYRLGSVMIGTLAHFQKEIRSWGGELVLKSFTMMGRQPFAISRLTESFTWTD